MSQGAIKYFRDTLRKKLKRPCCGRYLPLWDEKEWKKYEIDIPYKSNDFIVFLYQIKTDLCCIQDTNGQVLCNAIDKFFYLLFDFETFFNIFLSNNIYETKVEIIDDVSKFNQLNISPSRLYGKWTYLELFHDLRKKMNEWNYWKRTIAVAFAKIVISDFNYIRAQENISKYLQDFVDNIEKVFNSALEK